MLTCSPALAAPLNSQTLRSQLAEAMARSSAAADATASVDSLASATAQALQGELQNTKQVGAGWGSVWARKTLGSRGGAAVSG